MNVIPDRQDGSASAIAQGRHPPAGWRVIGINLVALLLLLLLFRETLTAMVSTWTNSVTYNHGFLIAPISLFLLWLRRRALAAVTLRPDPLALVPLAFAGFAWLLGELVDVNVVREFALVTMFICMVWLINGRAVTREVAFPLGFLYFAVPFGDFLVMPLMIFTADVTIALVRASGIPVFREGLYFSLPTGHWAVVEACSGIRYLIASVTLGALYAYLMYRSIWRIAFFMALAVAIPIVANALRAYMIVMIGHFSGMELAVGVDHLLYGWVFFGVVIFLMFWAGTFFQQSGTLGARQGGEAAGEPRQAAASLRLVTFAVAGLIMAALLPAVAASLDDPARYPAPDLQPPEAIEGWQAGPVEHDWQPGYADARASFHRQFAADDGRPVFAFAAYYNDQRRRGDVLYWRNGALPRGDGNRVLAQRPRGVAGSTPGAVIETRGRTPNGNLIAWEWYWVDGTTTTRRWEVKARESLSRLLARGDDAAAVVLYAYYDDDPDEAREALGAFLGAMGSEVQRSLDTANAR